MATNNIKATIFIPTYNGEKYIKDILWSIYRQKVSFEYEVLIIDSGSSDKTLSIIELFQKKHDSLRLVKINNSEFGHGKTRNYAAEISNGEIMVYLSHDAIPAHKEWLYEMLKPFEMNKNIMGVIGKQIARPKCVPLLKFEIDAVFRNLGPEFGVTISYKDTFMRNPIYYDSVTFYSDVNSATRRDFILNTIPYRDVTYSEDQLFGRDIIDAGYYKAYSPRARVIHSNDLTLREYKHRVFDEIVGLRRIGAKVHKPSLKAIIKMVIFGSIKDAIKTVRDGEYSTKRKLYWLAINPLYHIEKWHGYTLGVDLKLKDNDSFYKHSLEAKRKI
jgi:rhamnosyltransferase